MSVDVTVRLWTNIFDLAYAWAVAELGRDQAWRIVWPYLDRLTQTSPETATWGALRALGLLTHERHLKELIREVESAEVDGALYLNLHVRRQQPVGGTLPTATAGRGRRGSPSRDTPTSRQGAPRGRETRERPPTALAGRPGRSTPGRAPRRG